MSFSQETKNELSRLIAEKECCKKAELAALIRSAGMLQIKSRGQVALHIVTENSAVARKIFFFLKKIFFLQPEVMVRRNSRLKKNNTYLIRILRKEQLQLIFDSLGMTLFSYKIPDSLVAQDCCAYAYLRGSFLGGGSLNDPSGKDYHFELVTDDEGYSHEIVKLLERFGVKSSIHQRKQKAVIYVKEADQIVELLHLMGAHKALMDFENVRIVKSLKNRVNRLVNCETANLEKTVTAAMRQVEIIQTIQSKMDLKCLPKSLAQLAELRLNYPEASFKELGEMMTPAVSKSGVNYRMRKLEGIAKEIR